MLRYDAASWTACSATVTRVTVSALKTTFAARLHEVEDALYADAMRQRWFRRRRDQARSWSVWKASSS